MSLGLQYGRDPRWFYDLPREQQVQVLAYHIVKEKPPRRAPLPKHAKVAESARDWWGV